MIIKGYYTSSRYMGWNDETRKYEEYDTESEYIAECRERNKDNGTDDRT